ncbi:MAG: SCO family protein [Pirellulaceae bacterium]
MRILITTLMVVGLVLIVYLTLPGGDLDPGQAGRAFVENEEGELIESDGHRQAAKTVIPPPDSADADWLEEWTLTERSEISMGTDELRGTPYVAGFFFSTCGSVCLQQNGKMKELQDKFRGQPIRMVSISVDPEIDQPETLRKYAKRFDADAEQWLFCTGDMKYIRRVGSEFFRLPVVRRGHPEKFGLVDKNGKLFGLYTWSDPNQWGALEKDIEKLIAAGGAIEEPADGTSVDTDQAELKAGSEAEVDGSTESNSEAAEVTTS